MTVILSANVIIMAKYTVITIHSAPKIEGKLTFFVAKLKRFRNMKWITIFQFSRSCTCRSRASQKNERKPDQVLDLTV